MTNTSLSARADRRQYPRLALRMPATLEVRSTEPTGGRLAKRSTSQISIQVSSMSPTGLGFTVNLGSELYRSGRKGTIHLDLGGRAVELPITMVRLVEGQGSSLIGVRIELAAARLRSRHDYADWIVARLREL